MGVTYIDGDVRGANGAPVSVHFLVVLHPFRRELLPMRMLA